MSTKLAWELNTGSFSRQTYHLTEASAHAPQRLRSRKLRWAHRRAASSFVWLVDGEERWAASDLQPHGVLPQNWGGTQKNRTVTCTVLKTKADDRRKNLALSRVEFRGP
ncbi:hypothetical protein TNCV_1408801 [Trichonephila clavipes]|uniref:Uncharacterized protein n=1 Tax=Trichonephila clavipes TaxID=2585209 RepID=A0A8X6RBP5_TRICX|nr:hypothetical protein TNCV_1408801 [Trichonephila clavipes]